jgi:serine/threonine-protein kinase RsbW
MKVASTLRIPAELENLERIRRFVTKEATALGADPDAVPDLVLAVDEAATNIIMHGYLGETGTIEIEVGHQGDALVVRLCDQAVPFDPNDVPPPDLTMPLEERPIGGLGVYMMRQLVDQVIHRVPPQGGNELTLVKEEILSTHKEDTDDRFRPSGTGQSAGDHSGHPGRPGRLQLPGRNRQGQGDL